MADILPQLIEFATQLDLQRLIVVQTTICLFAAIRSVPAYNLPLFFFGLYAYQHHDSAEPLQQFAAFTAFTILLDIVWCILASNIGLGEGLTIVALLLKPMTIISALQLLKYRGDPFSSFSAGNWAGRNAFGGGGGIGGYQSLGDAMDDERDAEEISIPRHRSHSVTSQNQRFGRPQTSQQSSSFVTSSSRSTSVKSNVTGSAHNVEMGTGHHGPSPASAGTGSAGGSKNDRRDKVGQNISDDDEDASSRETPANAAAERAGYQSF
ncbi:hypothetical protein B0O80DRAFT_440242 [Mortierella sp. GBAus27b]|nr:hypothetical protein B0O80DRAFT_440242 [Mortierella sp. GBAus27b]